MHGRILFFVSLLFVALLDHLPLKFLFFINLLFIGHKNYNNHLEAYKYSSYTTLYRCLHNNGLFTSA